MRSVSAMHNIGDQESFDLNDLYIDSIVKYMSPWILAASYMHTKPVAIGESFPMFTNAHLLELRLLTRHYIIHFRITRYRRVVTESGTVR